MTRVGSWEDSVQDELGIRNRSQGRQQLHDGGRTEEAGDPVGGFGDFGPSHPGLGHLAVFHLIVLYLLLRNQPEFKLTLF